jgi:hypothetical protein
LRKGGNQGTKGKEKREKTIGAKTPICEIKHVFKEKSLYLAGLLCSTNLPNFYWKMHLNSRKSILCFIDDLPNLYFFEKLFKQMLLKEFSQKMQFENGKREIDGG